MVCVYRQLFLSVKPVCAVIITHILKHMVLQSEKCIQHQNRHQPAVQGPLLSLHNFSLDLIVLFDSSSFTPPPQNHLIVKVPPYQNQTITSSLSVGIYVVTNAGRSHDVQPFTYTPDSGVFKSLHLVMCLLISLFSIFWILFDNM